MVVYKKFINIIQNLTNTVSTNSKTLQSQQTQINNIKSSAKAITDSATRETDDIHQYI